MGMTLWARPLNHVLGGGRSPRRRVHSLHFVRPQLGLSGSVRVAVVLVAGGW